MSIDKVNQSIHKIIDMNLEWPQIYEKVKHTTWFHNIATFYYEMAGKLDKVKSELQKLGNIPKKKMKTANN